MSLTAACRRHAQTPEKSVNNCGLSPHVPSREPRPHLRYPHATYPRQASHLQPEPHPRTSIVSVPIPNHHPLRSVLIPRSSIPFFAAVAPPPSPPSSAIPSSALFNLPRPAICCRRPCCRRTPARFVPAAFPSAHRRRKTATRSPCLLPTTTAHNARSSLDHPLHPPNSILLHLPRKILRPKAHRSLTTWNNARVSPTTMAHPGRRGELLNQSRALRVIWTSAVTLTRASASRSICFSRSCTRSAKSS